MYQFGTLNQQPSCAACHQPIQGNCLSALGTTWHPEHFVCSVCGRPISDAKFNVQDGKPYHTTCFRDYVVPRCAYCGKPLTQEFLIDSWGTKYCKEHRGQYPPCDFCGRLVPPQQQERRGEGTRCLICRSTAVETSNEAQPLFQQCKQWLSHQGLKYNNQPLSIELVHRAKLADYLRQTARVEQNALGATMASMNMQGSQIVQTDIQGIAVLQGLPATLFQGVVIHELGHVWLWVHGIYNLPSWAEEGFCELLTHRFHRDMHTPEHDFYAQNIERNPDPIYGEGYRRIRTISDKLGFEQFMQHLSAYKRLP